MKGRGQKYLSDRNDVGGEDCADLSATKNPDSANIHSTTVCSYRFFFPFPHGQHNDVIELKNSGHDP